ncbi:hypothetical protein [Pantanalinema sp. GBBB05]|uniref:hypothetical protein n=1 Tax=Pantanalinema sp. GBBB05 TaxID=2604139 RepID=UPI001E03B191|nr:hypothetical protein [Pantanalinema sp. GBBB05]
MLKQFLAITVFALVAFTATPALAQSLPVADSNGDFSRRTGHEKWIVVDRDPDGLNCRWSSEIPTEWYAPDAQYPRMNIREWSVVRRFPYNTVLVANMTPAGMVTMFDEANKPWLKVTIGDNDKICLVRANNSFIRPLR